VITRTAEEETALVIEATSNDPLAKVAAAKEHNINFVELQFTDLLGVVKGVTIPLYRLVESLEHGTWFDGSSIEGFTRIAESDQWLAPDMDTFAEIPWQPGHADLGAGPLGSRGTARVICDVMTPDGKAFDGDPRGVLKRQLKRALDMGYVWNAGPELEFFLFRKDAEGNIRPLPHDTGGYFDFNTDLAQSVRRDMVNALEAFGIRVEAAHHEVAYGQHEIDFQYADGLKTADNAVTFKFTLKAIANLHGLYATFMPKPIFGINGSGMHTHQSLFSIEEGKNAFAEPRNKYGLSKLAQQYMAGILAHARGMSAILAPLVNSYKRLVPGYEAPTYLTWGRVNRSALIRVPKVSPGRSVEATRVEVRCPDPASNTYLAFAVMLAAGLDGIEKGMKLADPVEESLYSMEEARLRERNIQELPGTLREALDELEKDEVIGAALGDHVLSRYLDAKREEWDEYRTQVTQWELERYLEAY
jgi:glutamine synthetase